MAILLKCYLCNGRASYSFLREDFIKLFKNKKRPREHYINICIDCNNIISKKVHTFPLIQVIQGGLNKNIL